MKKSIVYKIINILAISYLCLYIVFLCGCSSQENKSVSSAHQGDSKSTASEAVIYPNYYSPLTFGVFDAIRNDTSYFSSFGLLYGTFTNTYDSLRLDINCGNWSGNFPLSSFNEFKGSLVQSKEISGTVTNNIYDHAFSYTELSTIFDFISQPGNQSYFFNGDEYDGLKIPYEHASLTPFRSKYNFSLIFFEPETWPEPYGWAIFKSVDEYPSPDDTLYGLFQLLETDFIPQFE